MSSNTTAPNESISINVSQNTSGGFSYPTSRDKGAGSWYKIWVAGFFIHKGSTVRGCSLSLNSSYILLAITLDTLILTLLYVYLHIVRLMYRY